MSWTADFAHLHVASSYSMRYGLASPAALAARAGELGMPALALTDRDGLYGAVKHAQACDQAGIAPILGADLALQDARGASGRGSAGPPARLRNEAACRVTLLACGERGRQGWTSLCRLVSAAHRAGERGVPGVTADLVAQHADGLIVLLGPASDVGRAVAARRPDLAAAALARWRERAETVVEIVDYRGPGDLHRAARMLRLAREAGVCAVLSNAVRYLDPADEPVAQVLDAARRLVPLEARHLAGRNAQAYLKSSAAMARIAARVCAATPQASPASREAGELLRATAVLARRCQLDPARDLGIGGMYLPEISGDAFGQLRQRCAEGLARRPRPGGRGGQGGRGGRGGRDGRERARSRLSHELGIIARAGLASYFLTVADVAALIRDRGIRCAIRGSGAGSLVNYLIGISGIDPIEHGLIMERFLSEGRKGLPDIDLDVESARRIEAYRAILERYGEERCGCVSMMETYRARSAIRDTAAALGLPPHEIDAIAKAFGHIRARGIGGALAALPELRASNLAMPQLEGLFRTAERLDGLPRHIAMHPCGMVLSSGTLLDRVPVERSAEGLPLCQYDMDDVEAAGMIKLDVLGVRMQSAMTYALAEIERTRGERVDIDAIDPGDEPTFEMIRSGRTLGCFQIESPGQRELVTRLEPRDIGDLIVDISLFRPGPVNSDMINPYLDIRHGRRPACYPHLDLSDALGETGGVVIFHEQVLQVIDSMTGCGLSEAERYRRQLCDESARGDVRAWFRGAARDWGYDDAVAECVWQVLEAFGGFGFCKAHAAAFAIPTYQSAWLKRHYPAAFYAGVLTHDPGMYPKRVITGDARLAGIPLLPVDVNASAGDWQVEHVTRPSEGHPDGPREGLRVGLREVKGVGDAEVAGIIAGRPYGSLRDFWMRARVSRPVAERLVLAGALDSLYPEGSGEEPPTRRDLLARIGVLAAPARPARRDHDQLAFDLDGGDGLGLLVPAGELPELSAAERVAAELEILGIDVSQHVISFYEEILRALGVVRAGDLHRCRPGATVLVAGVKASTQTPAIRSGQRIIFATLDDATGQLNLAFFESVQERCAARIFGSWLLVVRGRVRRPGRRSRAVSVNATECWDLPVLEEIRISRGIDAVRTAMAAGDAPGAAPAIPAASEAGQPAADHQGKIVYGTGFVLSPYAETGFPGRPLKDPPRQLWHASPGSAGGWTSGRTRRPLTRRPGRRGCLAVQLDASQVCCGVRTLTQQRRNQTILTRYCPSRGAPRRGKMARRRVACNVLPVLAGTLLLLAAGALPAGAKAVSPALATRSAPATRSAAQIAGAGALPAGCAAPAGPRVAHCYLAAEPAPAAAAAMLGTTCTVDESAGWSPCNLRSAYKLTALSTSHGKGQTVAVIDAFDDPDAEADMGTYRSNFGLPPCTTADKCFEKVNQEGVQGNYPAGDMGWGQEISIDLDMVSAICPRCHILLVEADSNGFGDLFTAEQEAIALGAHVVSNSWGAGEFSGETDYDGNLDVPGVAITDSSGDGAYQGGVQYPSASPYVTSVGGTELAPAGNPRHWSEKTWVTAGSHPPTQGSGSGCSAYEAKPAWQTDNGCSNRTTADVSAVAANVLGYDSYESGGGGWFFFFGTSVSSPLVAGVYGLAGNASSQTVAPASLAYSNLTGLFDIVNGMATGTCAPTTYLCKAGKGYDGPTGLGAPKGISAF